MGVVHPWRKSERRLERNHGALGLTATRHGNAEIEMRDRQPMQQTYGPQRRIGRFLV
jgi:hypothetical protein